MQFNHDNMTGPLLAADLATLATHRWGAAAASETLAQHGIRRPTLTQQAADALFQWSVRLREPFVVGTVDGRCESINALMREGTTRTYLTTHDGLRPHLHFTPEDDDVVARVKAVTAGGLAIFTVESEGTRLGACRRGGCPVVFVDTSRSGRRAYCSTRCGNYVAVQRHRADRPQDVTAG